jgi:crotonobetainyl-CoA:carnitine CoA-transferase CaiB-like acyl-CoA transferase
LEEYEKGDRRMNLPLSGVRILDLSQIMAGPYCTLILGDLGAEIIKVERLDGGDAARGTPPHYVEGESAYFIAMNRNKKSMTLNLESETGKNLFYRLVKIADVVVSNLRPGAIEKLKVDYDTLKTVNPRIISCVISGYGQTGPWKMFPAFDGIIQARGGIMSFTGEPDRPPVRMGAPIGDLAGGMFAAHGVMAALYQREKTGKGQKIDISLLDCQISLLTYRGENYLVAGEIAQRLGSGHVSVHPQGAFKTKTFDLIIDFNTQRVFEGFCNKIGREDLPRNPKFSSREERFKNKDEVNKIFREIFLEKTGEEWLALFEKDFPIAPICTVDKALTSPQILSRNMVVEIDYSKSRKVKVLGNPIKMSGMEKEVFQAPPRLGEHNQEVLRGLLGYSDDEIKKLKEEKYI